jgi:aminodeoxyfutalosine synthase
MLFKDKKLPLIWDKMERGGRLDIDDGRDLLASPDLLGVGWMADQVRQRRHGRRATFVFNRQINPTNIKKFFFKSGSTKRSLAHSASALVSCG